MNHKQPLLIGLFIFLFTVITIFLAEIVFDELRQAIIAGLLVGILAALFEVRLAIQDTGRSTIESTREYSERLVNYLDLRNVYTENDWLLKYLQGVIELKQVAEQQVHDLARFQSIISQALEDARREVGTPYSEPTGDNEMRRIILLNEAVISSKEYVWAVSFDAYGYMERFWNADVFSKEYNASNIEAAKRGVKIERIFVVEKKAGAAGDKEKWKKLLNHIRVQKRGSRNITVYVASIEDLPGSLKESNTSFLVSDDRVGSESSGMSNGTEIDGYVSYGDKAVIDTLKQRFNDLRAYARKV